MPTSSTDSGKPKYLQIADDLVRQIKEQILAPGDQVPSESDLIKKYAASQGTVRKAFAELRATGLIETRHGKGSYVKRRPPVRRKSSDRFRRSHRTAGNAAYLAEAQQAGSKPSVSVLYVGPTEAPEEIAERLSVPTGAKVLARRRLYFSDGIPTEEATSYLPWDVAKDIPELFEENPGGGGIYARLEEHGHTLKELSETVRVRLATKQEIVALSLSPGSPIIHLTRNAESQAGRVVEVCDTFMAADQFVLEYRIPADD
ncbi:GntR family transcriptional regulator [Streptomyces sp. NBC_00569]|uniref:GntR family transcriptional regulator n=1 Tax=unclassified Streptomyces TaxID=2593676 RepID=UPI002255CEE8|nr:MULTISPECIES: GntR family transcriptional regulator [unclassified Streptomyces]MCX5439595.1 GntR family transcriptional regulator [Streptomyces sp. NBC_00063]WUB93959.1 GntR family transcriptional regulator [Streptomyces sp. NBC_00569]